MIADDKNKILPAILLKMGMNPFWSIFITLGFICFIVYLIYNFNIENRMIWDCEIIEYSLNKKYVVVKSKIILDMNMTVYIKYENNPVILRGKITHIESIVRNEWMYIISCSQLQNQDDLNKISFLFANGKQKVKDILF
jgi:hypothetical protein